MAQGMRPGGLTAMAVVNFVFAGMSLLGMFGLLLFAAMGDEMVQASSEHEKSSSSEEAGDESGDEAVDEKRAQRKKNRERAQRANVSRFRLMRDNKTMVFVHAGLMLLYAIFLLLSGLGYIGQKRVMGRYLGTITAFLGIGLVGFSLAYLPLEFEQIVNSVYPILSLFLLHTVFRQDFTN